ncbi:protein phosphatase 1 regulatory inhibitor subunit PPP1R7 homolog [Gossypium raimondii]|uniref:protein phosphatase 1 regulatory inhibitor subunit PPP1R7 homolog n=1 Tax=Gossypium raimondii TaxID=29730 RepID=UPI00227A9A29|nr:protein phosphatase 1 regulatory inhibitor subunit PPP1R7 homolog [Gossypium raimondii]
MKPKEDIKVMSDWFTFIINGLKSLGRHLNEEVVMKMLRSLLKSWECQDEDQEVCNLCLITINDPKELILRDNKLTKIPDVVIFKKLLVFDVSFNEITSLQGLSKASSTIKELYVSKNEVTKMEEIDHLHELQILELGSHKLRVIENLQNFTKLQELWLGRNQIKVINLCGLSCIKKISLQSNQLTSMIGLEECNALEEIYLSHNGIAKMEDLSKLVNLQVLDVSSNKLTSFDDIQYLTRLEDLWLNDNRLESLEDIAEGVSGSREKLTTIYLENNPCVRSPSYSNILDGLFSTP